MTASRSAPIDSGSALTSIGASGRGAMRALRAPRTQVGGPGNLTVRMPDVPGAVDPDESDQHAAIATGSASAHGEPGGDAEPDAEPGPAQERIGQTDQGVCRAEGQIPGARSARRHTTDTSQQPCRHHSTAGTSARNRSTSF